MRRAVARHPCQLFISFVNQSHGASVRMLDGFIVELVCEGRSTIDSDFYNTLSYFLAANLTFGMFYSGNLFR
jgi:hypothetical protein